MLFTTMRKTLMLTGGVLATFALLVFAVAACTSGPAESTTAGSSIATAGGSPQTQVSLSGAATQQASTTPTATTEAQIGLLHTVTVSGTGHMSALPDQAVISIGVQGSASTAAAALDANSKQMQQVLARDRKSTIPDAAIETTNVSVYPNQVYDQQTGRPSTVGYQAANSVNVTLTDFSAIGKVFAAAAEAGANNLSGPSWQLSDNTKAQTEALAQASSQARAKAEAFAAANGVTLGGVLVLTEGYSSPVYYYGGGGYAGATTTAGAMVSPPPISPQNLDIYITATITYELK
ncbi:MAG: SIMPL domain-containing protein [Chloroflexi bacterium]|nr:SIMPL domain-containing protein [Chloroflexota bacterium]